MSSISVCCCSTHHNFDNWEKFNQKFWRQYLNSKNTNLHILFYKYNRNHPQYFCKFHARGDIREFYLHIHLYLHSTFHPLGTLQRKTVVWLKLYVWWFKYMVNQAPRDFTFFSWLWVKIPTSEITNITRYFRSFPDFFFYF